MDANLYLITVNPKSGDIIVTGADKLFKKYLQPEEQYKAAEHKLKPPAQN